MVIVYLVLLLLIYRELVTNSRFVHIQEVRIALHTKDCKKGKARGGYYRNAIDAVENVGKNRRTTIKA